MSKYNKGTLGWLKEKAKKDGFDNIRDWQNWKIEQENKQRKIRPRITNKEQICDIMRKFYDGKGVIPIVADFQSDPKYPGIQSIQKICGSWNNAIKDAGLWEKRYNPAYICDRCGKSFKEVEKLGKFPIEESDKDGKPTGRWDCPNCYEKYDPNSISNARKSVTGRRTGSLNPNSDLAKGCRGQKLLCRWKGFMDLTVEYDNHEYPIDCQDPATKLYFQVKAPHYSSVRKCWQTSFKNELNSIGRGFRFKSLFLFCVSADGKIIERVYEIPEEEVEKRSTVAIYKNPMRGTRSIIAWYEKYRVKDLEELENINKIWNEILREEISDGKY